jgi:hypothetical protein
VKQQATGQPSPNDLSHSLPTPTSLDIDCLGLATESIESSPNSGSGGQHPQVGTLRFQSSGHVQYEPPGSLWSSVLDPSQASIAVSGLDVSAGSDAFQYPFDLGSGQRVDALLQQLPPESHTNALKNVYFGVFAPVCSSCNVLPRFLADL